MRSLWIIRINAAARQHGVTYSQFMHLLRDQNVGLDRKILADLAVREPAVFERIVSEVKAPSA
jgi:large subunit ribosomal protein L20